MTATPEVAVVVPTRDRAALLAETLDSVAAQTFTDWECLIVDDGSSDSTPHDVSRRAKSDLRFRYVPRRGNPSGANACRNLGLSASRAALLVFLDSDDLLEPACLAQRVSLMQRNDDLSFAVFDAGVFHDRPGDLGRAFDLGAGGDDLDRFLALDPPWHTTGPIWRREALERIGAWNEQLTSWQDIDLHIRALAAGLSYVRHRSMDHHVRWRPSPDRISHRKAFDQRMFENCEPCPDAWRQALATGGAATPARDEAIAGVAFHLAEQWALRRQPGRGREVWRRVRRLGVARGHLELGTFFLFAMATRLSSSSVFRGLLRRWKIMARLMRPTSKHGVL